MRVSSAGAGYFLLLLALVALSLVTDAIKVDDNPIPDDDENERQEISTSLRVDNRTLGRSAKLKALIAAQVSGGNGGINGTINASSSNDSTIKTIGPDERSLASNNNEDDKPEELPEALELRYVRPSKYRRPYLPPTRRPLVNRRNVYHDKSIRGSASSLRTTRRPLNPKRAPTESECTFFSKTVCLEAADYPMDAIMRSIRNNKEMVTALLADFKVQDYGFAEDDDLPQTSAYKTSYDNRYDKRYEKNRYDTGNEINRRFEFNSLYNNNNNNNNNNNVEEGYTCPSQVKYAQPQLARAASGVWKYIINTGEHTQTLRLEKCLNPQSSCSFISENYRSSCAQVYNYHRLLTWDSKLGLHMDIFKVPTCCTCHVHGYTDLFPPHQTDPPLKAQEPFPGADFATGDSHVGKGTNNINKYANSLDSAALNLFRENYGQNGQEQEESQQQLQHSSSSSRRPSIARPPRPRKPSNGVPRPFNSKLPQQHAPNTRAPGYKGPWSQQRQKGPFRRDSPSAEVSDNMENSANFTKTGFGQTLDWDTLESSSTRLRTGGFDDEYQDTQRRVNYDYHPIIDFFKPEAAMLKSDETIVKQTQSSSQSSASSHRSDHDSWKPIFKN